jgi:PAS domain-containing protein
MPQGDPSDFVTIVDRDGTILFQSPSVVRVLGWGAERTEGTSFVAALHERRT